MCTWKFVILKSLEFGSTFFTLNDKDRDFTKLNDGTVAYKVLGYARSTKEAQMKLYGRTFPSKR